MAKSQTREFSFDKISRIIIYPVIIIAASALFFPFLGKVHLFDWDEINFAEAAREMIVSGDFLTVQIDYRPFLQKPPLFIWLQALSMMIFGVNEFAARFPNALLGVIQLMFLFHIGKKWHDKNFGVLWVIIYAGSILPFFYFKSAIIDPWFNFFIFLGFVYFIEYLRLNTQKIFSVMLSGTFMGLAILTKGPVAFLIFMLVVGILWLFERERLKFSIKHFAFYILALIVVGGSWFIVQIFNDNLQIVLDFIWYQIKLFSTEDAGHGGFFLYHFVVLFFGVFPASVFAISGLFPSIFKSNKSLIYRIMYILFLVVLVLFTIVKTKIVHYSSLAYIPITYLAALSIKYLNRKSIGILKWQYILLFLIAFFIMIAVGALQYIGLHANELANSALIKDQFAKGNLMAQVDWTGFEFLIGIIPLAGLVLVYFLKTSILHKVYIIATFTAIFMFLAQLVLVPRIEKYSQNAAIEFFKLNANQNVVLETIGYKSYAHYYYGNRMPKNQHEISREDYLNQVLIGQTDKTVFAVTKVGRWDKLKEKYPDFVELYSKNGFIFLVRKPKN
jgi:4-amino-4-deoxy-L-arabinose transferase-like glycosyltransferase